jgi:hypothetical protein
MGRLRLHGAASQKLGVGPKLFFRQVSEFSGRVVVLGAHSQSLRPRARTSGAARPRGDGRSISRAYGERGWWCYDDNVCCLPGRAPPTIDHPRLALRAPRTGRHHRPTSSDRTRTRVTTYNVPPTYCTILATGGSS